MILDWARLLSVPKVFCWCLILLLSWLAITENLKNWPDLASLAALVFSLTLCTLFFSPVLHLSFTKFKCSWVGGPLWTSWSYERKCKCKFIILIQILFPSYYGSTRNCWCDFLSAITHHSAEHERMAQTEHRRHEATSLTRVTPRDRYLTQDQSQPFLSHLAAANIPPSILHGQ